MQRRIAVKADPVESFMRWLDGKTTWRCDPCNQAAYNNCDLVMLYIRLFRKFLVEMYSCDEIVLIMSRKRSVMLSRACPTCSCSASPSFPYCACFTRS